MSTPASLLLSRGPGGKRCRIGTPAEGGAHDLHVASCRRLAGVAMVYSLAYAAIWIYFEIHHLLGISPHPPDSHQRVISVVSVSFGVFVFLRGWRGKLPARSFNRMAMSFEVLAGLGIVAGGWGWEGHREYQLTRLWAALGGTDVSLLSGFVHRLQQAGVNPFIQEGVGWLGVWVAVFPLVIAMPTGVTALASLATATTLPLVMVLSALVNGIPASIEPWKFSYPLDVTIPVYICAGIAIAGSRVSYKLTRDLREARQLGSYRLVAKIGQGGMGEVWEARHRMLVRPAAVKLIRTTRDDGSSTRDLQTAAGRFEREAQATAELQSPHTVELYDFGMTDDGVFFYVMELLDGFDLGTLVERFGPVPAGRAVQLLRQACHSLWDAHERGLIHRDVKPANIFTCRRGPEVDFVKVLDFGLVKGLGDGPSPSNATLTQEGVAAGTPGFMPPEMVSGGSEADARTDIYALGCVAYWLLTGRLVFEGATPLEVILKHARDEPPPPSTRTELPIPPELERIVLQCLAKDPDDRPAGARDLMRRLEELEDVVEPWTVEHAAAWWTHHAPARGRPAAVIQGDAPTI